MQKNYQQKPPISLTQSLTRSFLQNQNVLLLHSKGIDIIPSLAQALYIQKSHLVIFIDFHQIEIQQLNYHLHQIKQQKVLLQEDIRSDKPQVFMINKFVREKRRKMYISGGMYALTQQVFIMDCLSDTQDLSTGLISKIFIKDAQYNLNDKFSITAWICTILGLNGNKTPITAISSRPNSFKSSNLQTLIRLLYTKKLVLWPFGRSQIHQLLTNTSLPNRNHKLPLTPTQQLLHSNLVNLLKYNEKSPNKADKKQLQTLVYYLLNYDKLNYLALLQNIVNQCTQYSIWKSSNSNIIEIIDKLVTKSRNCVYNLLLVKDKQQQNNRQKEQIYNGDEKQMNQLEIRKQQNYKQIKQKDIIKQTKYRIIDLNALIPKDNSKNQIANNQPQLTTSVPYKLQYQLHIAGLNQTSLQKSQLFPAKLLQIIRQVKNNWRQYNQNNRKIIINKQDQHIHHIIETQLQKINNRISNKYSKLQNKILSEIKQDKKEYNQQFIDRIKVERQKQVDQKDKDKQQNAEKQQDSSLKEVKQADIDFSAYQFNKIKINSQRQQKIIKPTLLKQQNQHKQQLQNFFVQNNLVKNSQQIKVNTPPKSYTQSLQVQFAIQDTNPIQQQRIIYICTTHEQLNKYLHYSIYCYENQLHYIAYLRKLYNYLHLKVQDRISSIKKLIKRYNNPNSSKTGIQKMLILEHQPILLQQLYIQLKLINQIIQKFSSIKDDVEQRDYLFDRQIQRLEFRYVCKQGIRLWKKDYNPLDDCYVTLRQGGTLCKARFCIQTNTIIHELNRNLRVLAPHSVFFYTPNISFIRYINIMFAQGKLLGIQQLHTIYFNNSIQSDKVIKLVKEEDESFWEIAQERKKLGQYMQNPQVRIKQLIIDDDIQKKARMISLAASTQAKNTRNQLSQIHRMHSFAIQRSILIDKRQFKSLLPSYLFHHGFKIIPVFLQNADYILSNDIGIQKKSVHTRDLHQSLKSGRLQEQVKRLCSKFAKPYLLIQCPDLSYFKKQQFSYGFNTMTGDKFNFNVRKQLIQIVHKNPKINLIWSTSYMETVKYFIQLKRNKDQPDLNKFKPQSEQMQNEILDVDDQISANQQQIL